MRFLMRKFCRNLTLLLIPSLFILLKRGPKEADQQNRIELKFLGSSITLKFLVEPSTVCEKETFVLVLVCSTFLDVAVRKAIRKTWARYSSPIMPVHFVMGVDSSANVQERARVFEEAREFKDMIIVNFEETYANLTLKTGAMLQWTVKRCSNALFVLKVDSDAFLAMEAAAKQASSHLVQKNTIYGFTWENTPVNRNTSHKWFVSRDLYPYDSYPPYCGGPAYLMTGDVPAKLIAEMQKHPQLPIEDVFYTGIVAEGAGVERKQEYVFCMEKTFETCYFDDYTVSVHHGLKDHREVRYIWDQYIALKFSQ